MRKWLRRLRDVLQRIRREPVLLALVVSVAASLGLDDLAAQAGIELTQGAVAGAIGVVLLATRRYARSRRYTQDVEAERDQLERELQADGAPGEPA